MQTRSTIRIPMFEDSFNWNHQFIKKTMNDIFEKFQKEIGNCELFVQQIYLL